MSGQPWKALTSELMKWLHRFVEHPECDIEDFLQRAAIPLLFYAKKAKNEINKISKASKEAKDAKDEGDKEGHGADQANSAGDAVRALLCIRLLAQQVQSLMQRDDSSEIEDLALPLAHWVSTEWCSPRIEVVAAWLQGIFAGF